jgi:hypothetical protein
MEWNGGNEEICMPVCCNERTDPDKLKTMKKRQIVS